MGKLAGKFQGGYGGSKGATNVKGYDTGTNGRGTMPFTSKLAQTATKDIIPGAGQREILPNAKYGRILKQGNGRSGMQESGGPE